MSHSTALFSCYALNRYVYNKVFDINNDSIAYVVTMCDRQQVLGERGHVCRKRHLR